MSRNSLTKIDDTTDNNNDDVLSIISRISSEFLNDMPPQQILMRLGREVLDLFSCDIFLHHIADYESRICQLQAHAGFDAVMVKKLSQLPFDTSICGRVVQTRKREIINDIDPRNNTSHVFLLDSGLRTYACFPVAAKGKVLGTISFGRYAPRSFTNKDLITMSVLAEQIAIGLWRIERKQRTDYSEQLLHVAIESTEIGMWSYTIADHTWILDEQAQRLYRIPSHHAIHSPETLNGIMHPDDVPVMWDNVNKACDPLGDGRYHAEYRILQPDGTCRWLMAWGRVEFSGSGASRKPIRIIGASRDLTNYRRAQEELRQSEERLRLFVEHAPAALAMFDRNMNYVSVSNRWLSDYGLDGQNIIGHSHYDIFPEIPQRWRDIHSRALAGEIVRSDRDPFVRADGRTQWLQWEVRPWHDSQGKVAGIVVFSEDITHRILAENEIQLSNERLRLLSETAGKLLASEDPQALVEELCGKVMRHLNCDAFFNFLVDAPSGRLRLNACAGIPREEAKKIEWLDFGSAICGCVAAEGKRIIAEDITHYEDPRTLLIKSYGIQAYCCHPIIAGGKLIGTLSFGTRSRAKFAPDEIDLMSVVTNQVAVAMNRILSEQAIRHSEEHFRTLANILPQLVWTADTEGNVDFYNDRASEFAGLIRLPDGKWQWQPIVHPDDVAGTEKAWRQAIEQGTAYQIEHRVRKSNGSYAWHLSRALPQRDEHGRILKWFGTATDIEAIKQAGEEVRQARNVAEAANAAKDHFLAVLSHELRTPLTPVLTTTQNLLATADLSPSLRDDLMTIQRNAELEARLIDDLLDLTRIARGKIHMVKDPVDISQVIQHSLDICMSDIHGKELHVDVQQHAMQTWVTGDGARLHQILWNLLKNAVKFTGSGGKIKITSDNNSQNQLIVKVTDNGIGISPDALPRLFNAFEQADADHKFGGLGLGLAISRKLAQMHGGSLSADSAGRDLGATFTLVLPTIHTPEENTGKAAQPLIHNSKPLRIMLVEDHVDTARMMARVLKSFGHQVTQAGTVRDAVKTASSSTFDLILSDIGLPDGTGLDLIREVRKHSSVPAIALTGYGMEEDITRTHDAGFTAHLTKPVNLAMLEQVIHEVTSSKNQPE